MSGQLDNFSLNAGLTPRPFGDSFLSFLAPRKEHMNWHNQPQIVDRNDHSSVHNFIVRRRADKSWQSHTTRPRDDTEQRANDAFSIRFGNCEIGNDVRCSANDMFNAPSAA